MRWLFGMVVLALALSIGALLLTGSVLFAGVVYLLVLGGGTLRLFASRK